MDTDANPAETANDTAADATDAADAAGAAAGGACNSPLDCVRAFLAHVAAAVTAALFYSRAVLLGRAAMLLRGITWLRVLVVSKLTLLRAIPVFLSSRIVTVLGFGMLAMRSSTGAVFRILIAFIVGVSQTT